MGAGGRTADPLIDEQPYSTTEPQSLNNFYLSTIDSGHTTPVRWRSWKKRELLPSCQAPLCFKAALHEQSSRNSSNQHKQPMISVIFLPSLANICLV